AVELFGPDSGGAGGAAGSGLSGNAAGRAKAACDFDCPTAASGVAFLPVPRGSGVAGGDLADSLGSAKLPGANDFSGPTRAELPCLFWRVAVLPRPVLAVGVVLPRPPLVAAVAGGEAALPR